MARGLLTGLCRPDKRTGREGEILHLLSNGVLCMLTKRWKYLNQWVFVAQNEFKLNDFDVGGISTFHDKYRHSIDKESKSHNLYSISDLCIRFSACVDRTLNTQGRLSGDLARCQLDCRKDIICIQDELTRSCHLSSPRRRSRASHPNPWQPQR